MKRLWRVLALLLATGLLLVGCDRSEEKSEENEEKTNTVTVDFAKTESEMFTQRDLDHSFDAARAVRITLSDTGSTASSDSVRIEGSVITVTEEATYVITGTLTDGQIVVQADDTAKIQLVLDGASITSAQSAALFVATGDKIFLTLAEGSTSTLANGGSFAALYDTNIDGAVFSKSDLTIGGGGALTVASPAGHGIVCKDDLAITGGCLEVSAASHALDVNDSARLCTASLSLTAGKDAIHVENGEDSALGYFYMASGALCASAAQDGVDASAFVQIAGGTLTLTAGGASGKASTDVSTKGLAAVGSMLITGGSIHVDSADDALHANASIAIKGGTLTLASGDDGVHADETLEISAGSILISKSYEGLEALDITVSGGSITLNAEDDGLNAAGGTDGSGFGGGFGGDQFGRPGGGGRPPMGDMGGGMGGGGMSSSSDGSILISGGTLHVTAYGDGIDANGTLRITGGHVTVEGPTQGDTATLDYDVSGEITGGTFIGTGASGMAQSFSNAEQGVIAVRAGTQSGGTAITLTDKDGNVLLAHTPSLPFSVIILSSPDMEKGESYTLTVGGDSETLEAK